MEKGDVNDDERNVKQHLKHNVITVTGLFAYVASTVCQTWSNHTPHSPELCVLSS